METIVSIVQAGVFAIGTIIVLLVIIIVVVALQSIGRVFTPKEDSEESSKISGRTRRRNLEGEEPEPEETPPKPERPIHDKYPQVYRFEILYWRGVSKPWWWNNYAQELLEYAEEYFPIKKVNEFATYNSNSKSRDYDNSRYHKRILFLRTKKLSKHPLVILNYDEEYLMVDSYPALEAMKDRIDAEWYRHYGFQKTYRNSPTTY